ncbi:mus81 structure-specific endonuclease subunit [Rhynchophorus ferrugineus]|uniref:mus81 structure-specific endonuclease subunit n=1 Tax=Rhynchophorus ferrugineus TaxID=354439 RepID=UPI003FCCDE2A
MNLNEPQRISIKIKCPNPLFQQWLTEWREKAAAKGSKMQRTFDTALKSLIKYPLPLESGMDCKILIGFGNKLCRMLDQKLTQFEKLKYSNNIASINHCNIIETQEDIDVGYMPQYGSGCYAILMALYTQSILPDYPGFLKKSEIIQHGAHFINSSFTKPYPGSRYTAWSSIKTLINKKLVSKVSHPPKFSLTSEGTTLATKLYTNRKKSIQVENNIIKDNYQEETTSYNRVMDCNIIENINSVINTLEQDNKIRNKGIEKCIKKPIKKFASESNIISNNLSKKVTLFKFSSALDVVKDTEEYSLLPDTFDVILIVDVKEVAGKQHNEVLTGLKKQNIVYEVKDLKVGDFTWICRGPNSNNELVLPYIIERKRMDDFASSIKDKRYHEQKFRLKKSGIENLIYLVESYGKNKNLGIPLQTLYQATSYTAIQENFFIKYTENIQDTIEYLVIFSEMLKKTYKGKMLKSCKKDSLPALDMNQNTIYLMTFREFNESSIKNKRVSVTDLFTKMLIQVKGMSVERALAITKIFPTPTVLKQKYTELSIVEGEKLLANIKFGSSGKSIGIVLSKIIYQFFNSAYY